MAAITVVSVAILVFILAVALIVTNVGGQRERHRIHMMNVEAMRHTPSVAESAEGQRAQVVKAWEDVHPSQTGTSTVSPAEATALDIMGAIAALEYVLGAGKSGTAPDGSGERGFGSLIDLSDWAEEAGLGSYVDLLLARAKEHGYRITIEVTPGGPDQKPGYTCICEPVEPSPTARRRYFVDQRMVIRYTDDGSAPSLLSAAVPQNDDVMGQGFRSLMAKSKWDPFDSAKRERKPDSSGRLAAPWTPPTLTREGSVPRARITANERAAANVMQAISIAQALFQSAGHADVNGDGEGDYGTFEQLISRDGKGQTTPLVDPRLASGTINGYRFSMKVTPGKSGNKPAYTCTAAPEEFGKTGNWKLFVDESSVIRYTDDGSEPSICSTPLN